MPLLRKGSSGKWVLVEGEDLAIQKEISEADDAWEKTYGRSPSRSPSPRFSLTFSYENASQVILKFS